MRKEQSSACAHCYVKVHKHGKDTVAALCDAELHDKEILINGLRIRISREFYGGNLIPVSSIWEYVENATVVNAFGNAVVEELAKRIAAVRHAAVNLGGVLHVQRARLRGGRRRFPGCWRRGDGSSGSSPTWVLRLGSSSSA
jgi:hypothetical protein